jgi:diphthine synthase
MHEMEWEYVRGFALKQEKFDAVWKGEYAAK